jgi:Telomerase ribonucleoprotein complex - RNA binding domain
MPCIMSVMSVMRMNYTLCRYVRLGRAETLTLSQACIKIKITDIPWLPGNQQSQNRRSTVSNKINFKGGKELRSGRKGSKGSKGSKGDSESNGGVGVECKGLRSVHYQNDDNGNGNNSNRMINKVLSSSSSRSSSSSSSSKKKENTRSTTSLPAQSSLDTHCIQSGSTHNENSEIFLRFYLWLFELFVNPLISSSFYVTEAEGRGTEVHYYRKGVWNRILKKAKQQMGNHFMRIIKHQNLPPSYPRAFGNKEWLQQDDQSSKKKTYDNVSDCNKHSLRATSQFQADLLTQSVQGNSNIGNNSNKNISSSNNNNDNSNNNNNNNSSNSTKYAQRKADSTINLETAPAVRFVPKKLSVRPITNLKSRPKGKNVKDKNR